MTSRSYALSNSFNRRLDVGQPQVDKMNDITLGLPSRYFLRVASSSKCRFKNELAILVNHLSNLTEHYPARLQV